VSEKNTILCAVSLCGKIPKSKLQIPNNSEFANTNDPNQIVTRFGAWDLKFIWDLDIGI